MTYTDAVTLGVIALAGIIIYLGVKLKEEHKVLSYTFFMFAFLILLIGSGMVIDIAAWEI
jgi:hypothetical protein